MYRLLLVDDEPNILNALRRSLAAIPAEDRDNETLVFESFNNPLDALRRAEVETFDLVISDYRMPQLSGVEFLYRLIDRQPDIARMILSAYADRDALIMAINEVQISHFVNKPWHDQELRHMVMATLRKRRRAIEDKRLASRIRREAGDDIVSVVGTTGETRIERDRDGGIVLSTE